MKYESEYRYSSNVMFNDGSTKMIIHIPRNTPLRDINALAQLVGGDLISKNGFLYFEHKGSRYLLLSAREQTWLH